MERRIDIPASTGARATSGAARRPRLSFEGRIFRMALMAGFPGALVSVILLWTGDFTPKVQWTISLFVLLAWIGFALAARGRVIVSLQTLSNLLAALREGDYSFRGRMAGNGDDSLSEVMREINLFSEILREQRLGALEASALLRTVMAEIDVAVFAFNADGRLLLVNRSGEALLARPAEALIGGNAAELGLAECLAGEGESTRQMTFPGGAGRWGIRRTTFRQQGLPHHLLVLLDLSRPLRREELHAWQRLVRVLGHELNNSLAPIRSIAGSLGSLVARDDRPDDWREDMERGLAVIGSRAAALSRFMEAYTRLARLPAPRFAPVDIGELVDRVARLETRREIMIHTGPAMTISGDADQLEQLLINLLRNAVDAAMETGGAVEIGWRATGNGVEITIADEGEGVSNTTNLFVPFFTTKPEGSGIGLVLSRQIAEAHGGALTLENRGNGSGAVTRLILPSGE
ncbi:MAG: multi-sensor signal transduction histidine kinase [Chlorobi bacterium]|nr:multi-sensor signal transduction histidine kinase [Chlorobiota bacterium]